jgi:hypothetical protein
MLEVTPKNQTNSGYIQKSDMQSLWNGKGDHPRQYKQSTCQRSLSHATNMGRI